MTKVVSVAAFSMVSMMESSVVVAITVRLSGLPGRDAHWVSGRFGSTSIIVTEPPCVASSVASKTAAVDLPTPPLGLANTMVGMYGPCLPLDLVEKISESYSILKENREAAGRLSDTIGNRIAVCLRIASRYRIAFGYQLV
jgi:hypothetical protein